MFTIKSMTRKAAEEIATWKYNAPYDFYDVEDGPESIQELCGGDYYQVLDDHGSLVGYCCCGPSAQVPAGIPFGAYTGDGALDLGVGMKPELTGQGLGCRFFAAVLTFLRETHRAEDFRLTVATWNRRAIRLYEQAGFVPVLTFMSPHAEFQVMTRSG